MEELYLSSGALRSLSQLARYLILQHNVILKMSDPLVLIKVFQCCEKSHDSKTLEMFDDLKYQISQPSKDDSTSFVFYADERVLATVRVGDQNIVVRDKYKNESLRYSR